LTNLNATNKDNFFLISGSLSASITPHSSDFGYAKSEFVRDLDYKLDDGKPLSGFMVVMFNGINLDINCFPLTDVSDLLDQAAINEYVMDKECIPLIKSDIK
jgi:hypothetical protein